MSEKTFGVLLLVAGVFCLLGGAAFENLILMALGNISMLYAVLVRTDADEW